LEILKIKFIHIERFKI